MPYSRAEPAQLLYFLSESTVVSFRGSASFAILAMPGGYEFTLLWSSRPHRDLQMLFSCLWQVLTRAARGPCGVPRVRRAQAHVGLRQGPLRRARAETVRQRQHTQAGRAHTAQHGTRLVRALGEGEREGGGGRSSLTSPQSIVSVTIQSSISLFKSCENMPSCDNRNDNASLLCGNA